MLSGTITLISVKSNKVASPWCMPSSLEATFIIVYGGVHVLELRESGEV